MASQAGSLPEGYAREIAEGAASGTAETPRMLTEAEAYAISAANVQRETAAQADKIKTLETEKAELATKADVAETALVTEKTAREAAEKALVDFKAEQDTAREAASRSVERVAKVKETAGHLPEEFFTAERAERWAKMDDEAFTAYIAELAEVSPAKASTGGSNGEQPPRETAAAGKSVETKTSTDNLRALFPGMGATA